MGLAGVGDEVRRPDDDLPMRATLATTDVDEAGAFCRGMFYGGLRVRPDGDGEGFELAAEVVRLGPLTVSEVSYGTGVRMHTADLETAYHVLAPLTGSVVARHRGVSVAADPTRAAVFLPVGDIDLRSSPDCRMLNIKVQRTALERELDAALERQLASPLPLGASFETGRGPGRTWAALVRLLHDELSSGALLAQPQMVRRWRDLVVSGLALTVEHPYGNGSAAQLSGRRPRTVKRVLDAMHAEPGRAFTAAELAGIAGVGVRVLQDSFRRHVGVPPLTYLRRLRLDGVHAELSRADARQVSVSEVALRWGFTHMGRFAGAYRARFGVSPSRTLHEHR
jgi:AraC-like DNA-binding protein